MMLGKRIKVQQLFRYSIVVLSLLFGASFCSANVSADSLLTLRYKLDAGRTYVWHLVSDQFVVNHRSLRLNATFYLDAIDSDVDGNTQVRLHVKSSDKDDKASAIIDSVKNGSYPVGSRRSNKAGVYDAMIDQLGKIITGRFALDETSAIPPMSAHSTTNQFEKQQSLDIPQLLNIMLPELQKGPDLAVNAVRIDTQYVASVNQSLNSSRGSSVEATGKLTSFIDTVYRRISFDSTAIRPSGQQVCFLSVSARRQNYNGTVSLAETSIIRDARSGLIERVIEFGYLLDNKGKKSPRYVAVAVSDTDLSQITDASGHNVFTPPAVTPRSFR